MESFVDLFQDWPLQSYSLLCCNGKTISTRFRRITSHSKIATNDEPCCQDAIARIVFNFSKPGEGDITGVKIHGVQLLKRTDRGDLIKAQIFLKPPIITTMSNSRKASLQQVIQNWMTTVLGLLKSGKLRSRRTIDQGDLIKLLAEWYDKFDLITDNILLDGTAQSVRYGEVLRDRSGRPGDINSQEGARAQSFVIGNDETELELSVESRLFVNRVNDQVRKRQKIISNATGNGEEHSLIW